MEQGIADLQDEEAAPLRGSRTPVLHFEKLVPFAAPIGLLDATVHSDSPRWRESSPEKPCSAHLADTATADNRGNLTTKN
jgi:hypothetical protein